MGNVKLIYMKDSNKNHNVNGKYEPTRETFCVCVCIKKNPNKKVDTFMFFLYLVCCR